MNKELPKNGADTNNERGIHNILYIVGIGVLALCVKVFWKLGSDMGTEIGIMIYNLLH